MKEISEYSSRRKNPAVNFISERANTNQLLLTFLMAKSGFYFPFVNDSGRTTGIVSMQDVKNLLQNSQENRVCIWQEQYAAAIS
jgi:hypothetical protein